MIHSDPHPKADQIVRISKSASHPQVTNFAGAEFHLEDWWDRIAPKPWGSCAGNPACLAYAVRSIENTFPLDNEVVYGKIGGLGHLVHISEIE